MTGLDFTQLTGTPAEIRRFWHFFGVYYKRVPQESPPAIDWWTHRPETFDIEHTDGLFFLDPAGQERIVEEGMPNVGGRLSQALRACSTRKAAKTSPTPAAVERPAGDRGSRLADGPRTVPAERPAGSRPPSAAAASAMLAGSPSPLRPSTPRPGQLLGGYGAARRPLPKAPWLSGRAQRLGLMVPAVSRGVPALRRRLGDLRTPGSLPRCRHRRQPPAAASAFLAGHPVSYPSYQTSSGPGLGWRSRQPGSRRRRSTSAPTARSATSTPASTKAKPNPRPGHRALRARAVTGEFRARGRCLARGRRRIRGSERARPAAG